VVEVDVVVLNEISSPFPDNRIMFAATRHGGSFEPLFDDELRILEAFESDKRRQEFASGRHAAHYAIRALSPESDEAIARNSDRTPQFPTGIVGSISHSGEISVAAVARSEDFLTIGIDIQVLRDVDAAPLERKICTTEEAVWTDGSSEQILRVFSVKEAVYKAVYSGLGTKLTASEIRVRAFNESSWRVNAGPFELDAQVGIVRLGESQYAISGVAIPHRAGEPAGS
jgi:4'-phosphopantetheinyl transferase EntD